MSLELASLESAVAQLEEALHYYDSDLAARDPALKMQLRAAAIQAFEFTYELSFKMIKRHLEMASANPAQLDEMSFNEIMREAFRVGLVPSELSVWKQYRKNRGTTSHTYDKAKAQKVFESVPAFLHEARYLLDQLRKRNASLGATD